MNRVAPSGLAVSGEWQGMNLLLQTLQEIFAENKVRTQCYLTPKQGYIRAKIYQFVHILSENVNNKGGWQLKFDIDKKHLGLIKEALKKS